jgi:arylsulfatase A-like enzyme
MMRAKILFITHAGVYCCAFTHGTLTVCMYVPHGAISDACRLIKSGMSFTNFYSAPLCAMGRAEFLTGRSWTRTGNLFNA